MNPTEGEWDDSYGIIECNDVALFDRRSATTSDCQLITLAPAMRKALLEREEEIEKMYSKDDLERAIELARDGYVTDEGFYSFDYNHDEIINQLNQPQP